MAYKVAIDAGAGGNNQGNTANGIVEKDYTLLISNYINKRLNDLGIENFLVRNGDVTLTDEERVNIIKNRYGTGNNVIVISNRLNKGGGNGAEIMYALRNNSRLAGNIASALEDAGQNVIKYYQLRNSDNTALDEDYLIRNTANNQTLVVDYGYVDSTGDDVNLIKNNYEDLAEAVVRAIATYAGVTYYPVNGDEYYVVKKGDSLWSIASKYGVTTDELKRLNRLTSNSLSIGQLLKLPSKDNNDSESSTNKNVYVVKKGDSLYAIARMYNTTVEALKNANNLTSNTLSINQELIIPEVANTNQITYIVKKGDSLWLIANKYDTTVDTIKNANNLTSNNLSIGQQLIIPSTTNYVTYTVKKGDSLYAIARNYNTTVNDIKKINNLTKDTLSIGQKLLIAA